MPRLRQTVIAVGDLDRPVELLGLRGGDCFYMAMLQADYAVAARERARFQITADDNDGLGRSK